MTLAKDRQREVRQMLTQERGSRVLIEFENLHCAAAIAQIANVRLKLAHLFADYKRLCKDVAVERRALPKSVQVGLAVVAVQFCDRRYRHVS